MVYERVRGWTSGRSLPVQNFVKYPAPRGSIRKFCQKIFLECTKLMKVGIFLELDTTDVNDKDVAQAHFDTIEAWLPFYARLPSFCIVRGFALLAFAHEILN